MMQVPKPTKYRWLEVGKTYQYQAKQDKGSNPHRGKPCTVKTVPRSKTIGNVLVEFEDGTQMVVPAGTLKKLGVIHD